MLPNEVCDFLLFSDLNVEEFNETFENLWILGTVIRCGWFLTILAVFEDFGEY